MRLFPSLARFAFRLFSLALLALAQLSTPALAQTTEPQFSGLRWGIAADEVSRTLARSGFTVDAPDKEGDVRFTGTVLGERTTGFAMFADGRLAKVHVRLLTKDEKAIQVYQEVRESLITKYGAPTDTFETFRQPYFKGDGFAEQAIRQNKGTLATFWASKLSVEVSDKLTVDLSYESARWQMESERRKRRSTSVL